MQAKSNNLYYMIDSAFINTNRLFALSPSLNANYNDGFPERNSFDKYYMLVVEIKYFNVLINNKPFFKQLINNKKHMKIISKCQETMTIQEETSCIICIIKTLQQHWYRFIKREKHFSKNSQKINFIEELEEDNGGIMFFITEKNFTIEYYKQLNLKKYCIY